MRILGALLLTAAPPLLGLYSYYRTIYPYTLAELVPIIGKQLWYIDFRWLVISLLLNYYVLSRIKPPCKCTTKKAVK